MLYFPQLLTGAIAQFPIRKKLRQRTIQNISEDGHRVALADPGGATIEWTLPYAHLNDAETTALVQFFGSTQGSLNTFTFFDPTANLLVWSESLTHSAWSDVSLLKIQEGIPDPFGTTRASRLTNGTSGDLTLEQIVNIPANYYCCFSVFARADGVQPFTMTRRFDGGNSTATFTSTTDWQRNVLSSKLGDTSDHSSFSLIVPAGASIDVFGFQVNPQPAPSLYVASFDSSGVYPETRFAGDRLEVTGTDPSRSSCTVSLFSHPNT